VLAEMPEEWARAVQVWSRLIRARRGDVEGTAAPYRNDEYLLYQTLLGSWPMELLDGLGDQDALAAFVARVQGTMIKAVREAKLYSTWTAPDGAYEDAITSFVADALDPARPVFVEEFLPFARRVAGFGAHNSLVQTLLKFTAPGMPDTYQGAELWDLSMVDPDNRRPVDYALRARMLEDVSRDLARDPAKAFSAYLTSWRDGRLKLALIVTLLGVRRDYPELFANGGYEPLDATGPDFDQVCAYRRAHDQDNLIAAAARFPVRRAARPFTDETTLPLPDGRWKDLLTGAAYAGGAPVSAAAIFRVLPVAVLVPA
jgi:(1->4)-alpha-D-glucan 1-alpha-D-glucosylmutase